ncbi:sugar kinase, partial [Thioclava sp. BHET1]
MTERTAQPLRIACVGEVMIELSFTGADLGQPHLGTAGDTFNAAVYLQRAIGARGAVSYVTALGTDPFSDR